MESRYTFIYAFYSFSYFLQVYNKGNTAQKIKCSITDFFSKCNQIRRKLRIWSHFLKKSLMQSFIFCAVKSCRVYIDCNLTLKFRANSQKLSVKTRTKYFVGNKIKGRILKRMFQESKAHQICRKKNISHPLIHGAYKGVRNVLFSENLAALFS